MICDVILHLDYITTEFTWREHHSGELEGARRAAVEVRRRRFRCDAVHGRFHQLEIQLADDHRALARYSRRGSSY